MGETLKMQIKTIVYKIKIVGINFAVWPGMKKQKNEKGFTLIEVMIVVAIVGILAAIAIPQFDRFLARSKRTEAFSMLNAVQIMETAYYTDNDTYTFNFGFLLTLFTGNGTFIAPKYYSAPIVWGSDDLKKGYAFGVAGNLDKDITLDTVIIISGSPLSILPGLPVGYHILNDDLAG